MKATQALAELEKLGSAHDPVFYRPWPGETTPVSDVVWSPGMGDKDARKLRLDYWGVDRHGMFRLIQNGTLSGMLNERRRGRKHRAVTGTFQSNFEAAKRAGRRPTCALCHRPY